MRAIPRAATAILLLAAVAAARAETTPTKPEMAALGARAASGDLSAVDELDARRQFLYEGWDARDQGRTLKNLMLMKAALDPLGKAAGKDPGAFQALRYANGKAELRPFACDAFGLAAGNGNDEALDALLAYKENGWLLSSVVSALRHAAEQNQPKAVDFLVGVLRDPSARALHWEASQGLVGASYKGNGEAKAALAEYAREKN